jgi:hypothetical protein
MATLTDVGLNSNTDLGSANVDTIEELTKEVEALKKKLEEERAKFNDVACNFFKILLSLPILEASIL